MLREDLSTAIMDSGQHFAPYDHKRLQWLVDN